MDVEAALGAIRSAWIENARSGATSTLSVELPVHATQPSVTEEDLHRVDGLLGSFSTGYAATRTRGYNVSLAANRINGTVLAPGEVFSYNRTVGPRVTSAGFRQAPVILHGELVPGIGGGVCQVSSTLYNAVLLSGLRVVNRSHHAFPVHYLPAGRDATVVDGAIDFEFRNNTDSPICLASSARGGRLSFSIWGKTSPGRTIGIERGEISTEPAGTVSIPDPELPLGRRALKTRGHNGMRVTVYRVIRENGEVVRREVVSRDYYRPFPNQILVGTKSRRPVLRNVQHNADDANRPPRDEAPSAAGDGQ